MAVEGGLFAPEPSGKMPGPAAIGRDLGGLALAISLQGLFRSIERALEQRRLFVLLPVAVVLGLCCYGIPEREPHPLILIAVMLALVGAALLLRRTSAPLRCAALLLAFWTGVCLLTVHSALWGTPMLGGSVFGTYRARVDEVLSRGDGEMRVLVSEATPEGKAKPVPVRRARLFIRNPPDLAPGDVVSARIRFYPVPGPAVPGGFDAQFQGYFDGIGAYASTSGQAVRISEGGGLPGRVIDDLRRGIAAHVDAHLRQPAAGIARAIINGDQSAVSAEARKVMATAGLAHVLSISGLHLTIVAGGVFAVLRLLLALMPGVCYRIPVKSAAALGGMLAASLYFAISGGNVAALRSTVMILLVFGAVLAGRQAITMRNVAIAAVIVLGCDPTSAFGASFQLSFAAVIGLVGAFESGGQGARPASGIVGHVWGYLWGLVVTSLVAGAATVLFSAYHFQQTSPLGVLGNLLSLPLVGFVMMPAAVLAVLLMPLGLEGPFLAAMGWSIDRMLDTAGFVATLSGSLSAHPLLTPLSLLIGLLALGWFAFLPDRWRLLGPALAVPAVFLFALDRPPDLLISDGTQALAIRTEEGLALATGRPDSFAVDVWTGVFGAIADRSPTVRCDSIGCRDHGAAGFSLAVVKDVAGFYEDCPSSDLVVVTNRSAPSFCRETTTVIDAHDLRRFGAHWLAWVDGRFLVRPAITDPDRPWRVSPR